MFSAPTRAPSPIPSPDWRSASASHCELDGLLPRAFAASEQYLKAIPYFTALPAPKQFRQRAAPAQQPIPLQGMDRVDPEKLLPWNCLCAGNVLRATRARFFRCTPVLSGRFQFHFPAPQAKSADASASGLPAANLL